MDLQIHLDQTDEAIRGPVCGRVILQMKEPTDISTIEVILNGNTTFKVTSELGFISTETHKIGQQMQVIFPPKGIQGTAQPRSLTFGAGIHIFPFQINFPQGIEASGPIFHLDSKRTGKKWCNIYQDMPPSFRTVNEEAAVNYSLEAVVRKASILTWPLKLTVPIFYQPEISALDPESPSIRRKSVMARYGSRREPTPHLFTASLVHGSILFQQQPIPLRLTVTKLRNTPYPIILKNFQTILIGVTNIRVGKANNCVSHSFVLTTFSNLDMIINDSQDSARMTWDLDADMWNSSRIPVSVIPSFDCGTLRLSYELEIRMGVCIGDNNAPTATFEFRFPVRVVSSPPGYCLPPYSA